MINSRKHTRKRWLRIVAALGLMLLVAALWSSWAELYPQQERRLRNQVQERLEQRLPAAMQAPAVRYGISPETVDGSQRRPFRVLLVHGLDEPGDIWADLLPVLDAAGFDAREFRYPNDQAIDRSANLLAASWLQLPADLPVVLIGHSMGGLVIRDFVSRQRHPVATPALVEGAAVRSVILVGTPNQGSSWARLRVWLELRDLWAASRRSGFSLLAGLLDGTGAAKIDLRRGSDFLADLNARPWPPAIQVHIIGGLLMTSAPAVGDGVVAADSLTIVGAPAPILIGASHRGMLARYFKTDDEPPAIPVIMNLLQEPGSGP